METIRKHIGEGFGKGELYAALAYDATDAFGGMQIKQVRFSPDAGAIALDFKDAHTGSVIETGTYGVESKGISLSATNLKPASFLFDDAGAALGYGAYRPLLSRVYLSTTQDEGICLHCLRGQLVVKSGIDLTVGPNFWNALTGVDGYVQILGATTIGATARVACVHATMQLTGAITVTSGGRLAGFFAEMSSITGATCTNPYPVAFLVDKLDALHTASQRTWENGLYIMGDSCVKGIYVGSCSTIGISIEGTHTLPIGIGTTAELTTATTGASIIKINSATTIDDGEYYVPVWVNSYLKKTGGGSIYGIRGHTEVASTFDMDSVGYIIGVHGRVRNLGTVSSGAAIMAGVYAQVLEGGTYTAVSHVCSLWADNQLNENIVAGQHELIYMTNNNAGVQKLDQAFYIYGPWIYNFFNLDGCGMFVVASDSSHDHFTGTIKKIKLTIDGVQYYMLASTTLGNS